MVYYENTLLYTHLPVVSVIETKAVSGSTVSGVCSGMRVALKYSSASLKASLRISNGRVASIVPAGIMTGKVPPK